MTSNSEVIESSETSYQKVLKELKTIGDQIDQMSEKAIKMRVECSLISLQMSTRIESMDSINALNECQRNAYEIKSRFEAKPNSEVKQIKTKGKLTDK